MAGRTRRFDDETQVQRDHHADAVQNARVALRPEVSWTDAEGAHSVLLTGPCVVGSAEASPIRVADPAVSRIHAELGLGEDGVWIRDLGSRNGTFVDRVRVREARVDDGGTVRVGSTELLVRYAARAAQVELWPADQFGPLAGRSAVMRELFARLARVAATDSTVLVTGETGTGKELVARAIHEASPRASAPYVVVDCASLPENLLESELFGHARGAFTGAVSARAGALESAEGGTVFLDEIGELPLAMQPKLLRALESRAIRRVGETNWRSVDVRFVCATHRDLRRLVNAGAFREDLYFRLAVLPIELPPLRERREDIPLLVERFLPAGAPAPSPAVMRELAAQPWLGNVRELRNVVERVVALGAREALSIPPPHGAEGGETAFPPVAIDEPLKVVRERWVDHLEREYLAACLERHGRNISAVARAAGLDRSYLYQLLRKHGL